MHFRLYRSRGTWGIEEKGGAYQNGKQAKTREQEKQQTLKGTGTPYQAVAKQSPQVSRVCQDGREGRRRGGKESRLGGGAGRWRWGTEGRGG